MGVRMKMKVGILTIAGKGGAIIRYARVKLGHAVTFLKWIASIISLKISIWNKIALLVSNLLNFPKLVVNVLRKEYLQNCLTIFLFLSELSLINIYIFHIYHISYYISYNIYILQELITKELHNFRKTLISIVFY